MNKIYIPENYKPVLDAYDTQRAIAYIKETFQQEFSKALNLKRVSAPLFVTESSGLNDNLNGYERPVAFDIPAVGMDAQVVHSLAKWKRLALKRYNFTVGNGLYTDMNAIRRDESAGQHSLHLRRPVGLGEGHYPGKPESGLPEAHRPRHRGCYLRHQRPPARSLPPAAHRAEPGGHLHHRPGAGGYATPVWKPVPSGKTPLSGSIRLPASCRSADFSAPASPTTAAPPTMTTGI